MRSLRARLLLGTSLLLLALMVLTAAGLERAFRQAALRAEEDKLRSLVYALLGAAEPDEDGRLLISEQDLPEPRLAQPGSGLTAVLYDAGGQRVWTSPSLLDDVPPPPRPAVGEWQFHPPAADAQFALAFGLRWLDGGDGADGADGADGDQRFTLVVREDVTAYQEQLGVFRRTLGLWLGGIAVLILLLQLALLGWLLRPLGRLVRELDRVEEGRAERITGRYPAELSALTAALNAMIQNERTQQTRYRHALDDLAHSLKTPLAVVEGALRSPDVPADVYEQCREPLERIDALIQHQLLKAATAGRRRLSNPVALRPLVERLVGALTRVYAGKAPRFDVRVPDGFHLRADQGDLYELLGNLLDNAAKWCRSEVRLTAHPFENGVEVVVEDDGSGFALPAETLVARGARADTRVAGQGLGLAAVHEIVHAYEGRLDIQRSAALGGARVQATLRVM